MTATTEALGQLASIKDNEAAPRNVRDAAKLCFHTISYGGVPGTDLIQMISAWIGKQNQQDRYGK